jgi:hypothetical protein
MHPFIWLIFFVLTGTAHGHEWLSGYKNHQGVDCCNISDCRPLATGRTVFKGQRVVVFPRSKPVEITTIHPSADPRGRTWVCVTGCAFLPPKM